MKSRSNPDKYITLGNIFQIVTDLFICGGIIADFHFTSTVRAIKLFKISSQSRLFFQFLLHYHHHHHPHLQYKAFIRYKMSWRPTRFTHSPVAAALPPLFNSMRRSHCWHQQLLIRDELTSSFAACHRGSLQSSTCDHCSVLLLLHQHLTRLFVPCTFSVPVYTCETSVSCTFMHLFCTVFFGHITQAWTSCLLEAALFTYFLLPASAGRINLTVVLFLPNYLIPHLLSYGIMFPVMLWQGLMWLQTVLILARDP